jgi:hypothetical protein
MSMGLMPQSKMFLKPHSDLLPGTREARFIKKKQLFNSRGQKLKPHLHVQL